MFCLIETTRNYDDKGEVVPWLIITLLCYVFVAVSDPGFAAPPPTVGTDPVDHDARKAAAAESASLSAAKLERSAAPPACPPPAPAACARGASGRLAPLALHQNVVGELQLQMVSRYRTIIDRSVPYITSIRIVCSVFPNVVVRRIVSS